MKFFARHHKLVFLTVFLFLSYPLISSATPQSIIYDYYNSGALKKVTYFEQAVIEYVYDNSGNMTSKVIGIAVPDVAPSPASLDFGKVHSTDISLPQTVTVTNNGTASLSIGSISITGTDAGQFTKQADTCSNSSIPISGTCQIAIDFRPTTGTVKAAVLTIASNDPDNSLLNVSLSGTGMYYLTVLKSGTGSGTVTSNTQPGIDCGGYCIAGFVGGTNVTLTATAGGCSAWSGWSPTQPSCGGGGSPCTVTINTDTSITAIFGTVPPVADFSASPVIGPLPLAVNFTNLSTCATSQSWDFGDGFGSTDPHPGHTYYQTNSYTTGLTVTNAAGSDTVEKQNFIHVLCPDTDGRAMILETGEKFMSLQLAYDNALDGDVIKSHNEVMYENLFFDLNKTVTLYGGFDCSYQEWLGNTTIIGEVNSTNGQVIMRNFQIHKMP